MLAFQRTSSFEIKTLWFSWSHVTSHSSSQVNAGCHVKSLHLRELTHCANNKMPQFCRCNFKCMLCTENVCILIQIHWCMLSRVQLAKFTFNQVMAGPWRKTNHYLKQYWPSSLTPGQIKLKLWHIKLWGNNNMYYKCWLTTGLLHFFNSLWPGAINYHMNLPYC